MNDVWNRRRMLAVLSLFGVAPAAMGRAVARAAEPQPAGDPAESEPGSEYHLQFTHPQAELVDDLDNTERGDPRRQSETAHDRWYSAEVRRRFGSWGPRARSYRAPTHLEQKAVDWKRERVIAVAARLLRRGYQHHHIPDWDPPKSWPWQETCMGHNGKGLDCSNFTSFVYNQG